MEIEDILTKGNLIVKIRSRVEECFLLAEAHYGEKIPRCEIKFDLTGTKGGTANFAERLLRFNRKLALDNEEEYMVTVVPHEVAHIIQRWKYGYGVPSHGNEWKRIMVEIFHIPPKRCHKMDVSKVRRKTKEYRYICQCIGKHYMVGVIKHRRFQKNSCICAKCLAPFVWEGKGQIIKTLQEVELD